MDVNKQIKKEEQIIEQALKKSIFSKKWFQSLSGIIILCLLLGIFIVWRITAGKIKTDNASIEAPIIDLSSTTLGSLEDIYVNVGDNIVANTQVAKVGNEIITSKVSGIIVSVNHQEGQTFSPGQPVVSMVNIDQERVVAKIDENKGLENIKIGQPAIFTVDTFGNKKYKGIIDEISPISDESGVAFNISDKRPTKQFDVKVRFDTNKYPELKVGMSAKITVFTN
jgi:multidrug resistance efflux pump